jgi:ankyrin repeat protein
MSLFSWAMENGQRALLVLLLKPTKGPPLDEYCDFQAHSRLSQLSEAARRGHLYVVELLAPRMNLELVQSSLVMAAKNGHLNVVQFLAERLASGFEGHLGENGEELFQVEDLGPKWTLLHALAFIDKQLVAATKIVLSYSILECQKDRMDDQRQTPFYYAAEKGHLELMRLPVSQGVKTFIAGPFSRTLQMKQIF